MKNEKELRQDILQKTKEYYELVHEKEKNKKFEPGKSKINYAGRVFNEVEMQN